LTSGDSTEMALGVEGTGRSNHHPNRLRGLSTNGGYFVPLMLEAS